MSSAAPTRTRLSDNESASVLVEHLFAQCDHDIDGLDCAVKYRLAESNSGGDIVDIYRFDNNSVALSIADISGKGTQAAVHAALIKYGLRAYASHGLTPEKTMRAMDRLYLENSTFESVESFASVFLGIVDPRRRVLMYSSAGHEPVMLVHPHEEPKLLPPTAPILGVFDDLHHLFREESLDLWPGTLLVATTDGVTEVRNDEGQFYGVERLMECVDRLRAETPATIVEALLQDVAEFCGSTFHDDIALLATRFH